MYYSSEMCFTLYAGCIFFMFNKMLKVAFTNEFVLAQLAANLADWSTVDTEYISPDRL